MNVKIGDKAYEFRILDDEDLSGKEHFNELAMETFGISFSHVGGQYLPYLLMDGETVASNISVNLMHFRHKGRPRFYIQLGIVMTAEAYRGRGLSRWLMERILKEWRERCDSLYLFANDSVLEFYPRFGFDRAVEYRCEKTVEEQPGAMRKLDMGSEADRTLLMQCYRAANPYAELSVCECTGVLEFYCDGPVKEDIYYLEEQGVAVIAEMNQDAVECMDIYGKPQVSLDEILGVLASYGSGNVKLGFTPQEKEGFEAVPHHEEDTTLFILSGGENLFEAVQMMFPVLSHT